jgi:hypothetical protein
MKLKSCLQTSICLMLMISLFACHTSKKIVADLDINNLESSLKKFRDDHKTIKNGDVVVVHVNNANKDLYTVKITPGNITYNTTVPAALSLSSLVLPGSLLPTKGTGAGSKKTCSQLIDAQKDVVKAATPYFLTAVDNMNMVVSFNNYLLDVQKMCGLSVQQIKTNVDAEMKTLTGQADLSGLQTFMKTNAVNAIKYYKEIDEARTWIDVYMHCDSCLTSIKATHEEDFTDSEKGHLTDMKIAYSGVLTFVQTRQAEIITQNYIANVEAKNYTFTAIDTAHHADVVNFNVSIAAKNWMPCLHPDTTFNIKLKVQRFKIDFSTGLFLNWGNGAFNGKNYFVDSNQKIQQVKRGSTNFIPSVGALMHIYYRSASTIEPGFVLGTSLSTDVKYTNFHVGLSFMLNTDNEVLNRLSLSGGLTYRYVTDLSDGYSVGTAIDKNLSIDEVQNGKFRRGGFVGITYNLSKN